MVIYDMYVSMYVCIHAYNACMDVRMYGIRMYACMYIRTPTSSRNLSTLSMRSTAGAPPRTLRLRLGPPLARTAFSADASKQSAEGAAEVAAPHREVGVEEREREGFRGSICT
jgi:hypothetical protein